MQLIDVYRMPALRCWKKSPVRPVIRQAQQRRDPCRGLLHARQPEGAVCLAGNRATKAFCDQNGIRYATAARCWSPPLNLKWNGCARVGTHGGERYRARVVKRRGTAEREPNITGLGGIFVPSSGIAAIAK